jgi:hypothetical protein
VTDSGRSTTKGIVANLNVRNQELAQVNIRKLKEFALNNIPKGNPLQQIILSEENLLDPFEFLAKVDVWLKLSRLAHQ